MKSLFIIVLAISIVNAEKLCTPGVRFNDDCNTCVCSRDGKSAACTDMACSPEANANSNDIDNAQASVLGNKQVCKPGSVYQYYCNTCTCSTDGLMSFCTRMYCDKSVWNEDGTVKTNINWLNVAKNENKKVCTPNTQFKEECNSCVCSSDGLSKACTMMICDNHVEKRSVQYNSDKICEAGKTYSPDGCNTCICNEDGTQSACTRKLCLPAFKTFYESNESKHWGPLYKQGDSCTPGKSFNSECNRCVCLGNGRNAFCTLMSCVDKSIWN